VLLAAVASTVSDGDWFVDMEDYGKERLAVLRQFCQGKIETTIREQIRDGGRNAPNPGRESA